jgi:hypothetical protein
MFGTVGEDRAMILDAMKHGFDKIKSKVMRDKAESFLQSFDILWGVDETPVDLEYKMHIADFMIQSVKCMDAWGFIPYYVKMVRSTVTKHVVHLVPATMTPGTFKVRQLRSDTGFERLYAIEPQGDASTNSLMNGPIDISGDKVRQLYMEATAVLGTPDLKENRTRSTFMISNQAMDGTPPSLSKGRYGIFVFNEPTIDGMPVSAAVNCLTAAHHATNMMSRADTASARLSNPPLVTEHVAQSGSDHGTFAPATSLLGKNDMSRTMIISDRKRSQIDRETTTFHNALRAEDMEKESRDLLGGTETVYDANARKRRQVKVSAFFKNNTYDIVAGQTAATTQVAQIPPCLEFFSDREEQHISRAFGIPHSVLIGETGHVGVNAELNQSSLQKKVFSQSSKIASATAYILNAIHRKNDRTELKLQLQLSKASFGKNADAKAQRAAIRRNLRTQSLYKVRFSRPAISTERVIEIADRGVLSREGEAALLMASQGLPSSYIELQDFPNPYEKPETEKPGGGASAKPKKPKSKSSAKK